jgi:L-lysine 6-oxidase
VAPTGAPLPGIHPLDQASIGNCVGSPMAPGIEVTWSTRNPPLYASPYHIRHRFGEKHYAKNGLSLQDYDETDPNNEQPGCEPGDLTKRMAIPWQADFFQCTYQLVNFTEPNANKDENHIPLPPTYYAYWWPPQSPMWVMSGVMTMEEQFEAGVPAGMQVFYPRGINSFTEMITAWAYLGFILNENTGAHRKTFPNFVERERNHDKFNVTSIAAGPAVDFITGDNSTFWPMWFLKEQPPQRTPRGLLAASPEARRAVRAPIQSRMRDHHED